MYTTLEGNCEWCAIFFPIGLARSEVQYVFFFGKKYWELLWDVFLS